MNVGKIVLEENHLKWQRRYFLITLNVDQKHLQNSSLAAMGALAHRLNAASPATLHCLIQAFLL